MTPTQDLLARDAFSLMMNVYQKHEGSDEDLGAVSQFLYTFAQVHGLTPITDQEGWILGIRE